MEENLMIFGLVGNEFLVNLYCDILKENPNTKLLAVCSSDLSKEQIESKGLSHCQNYDDLIHQHPEIDSIIICSPFRSYHLDTLNALWAGKNVLCKRPITTALVEIQILVETAKIMGKMLMIPFSYDYHKEIQKELEAKNRQDKKIINFSVVICENITGNGFTNDQDQEQKYAGRGCLTNLGADIIKVLYEFLGPLKVVSSKLERPEKYNPETSAKVSFTFGNNGKGILYSNSRAEREIKEITFLTAGGETIKIDLINKNSSREAALLHHQNALNHFINVVERKEHRGEKALIVQEIIHEIYQKQQ